VSEQPGLPGLASESTAPGRDPAAAGQDLAAAGSASAATRQAGRAGVPSQPGAGPGDGPPPPQGGISDFGKFDWFVESDGRGRPAGGRPGSLAGRLRLRFRRRTDAGRSWSRGRRLAAAAAGLALACTLLGGVIGGVVALHTVSDQTDPSYSLGSVPPVLANRPANSVAGIAARDTPSVVMIKVNGTEGTGSGFIINGGYIVTDNHVVTLDGMVSNATLRVYFTNGTSVPGVVVGRDPYSDIAVIKAKGMTNLPALTLGNSTGVAVGDPVIAIGSPLGLSDTVTSGIVSALNRPVQPGPASGPSPQVFFDAIQTDAPINPGNSGGPLVNAEGQVIGIDAAIDTLGDDPITGSQGGSIGLGFAIPIDQARRVVVQLIRTGHATHSVIGAALNESFGGVGAQIAAGHPGRTAAVTAGGPAASAGLRPGDVIVRFAGLPVSNAYSLLDAVRSRPPGARVQVGYVRQGQARTTTMTLGSAGS
jgi:putative serine protease PepD